MVNEVGTLAGLNAKPGDVVEFDGGGVYDVLHDHFLQSHQSGDRIKYTDRWYTADYFRIISRASDTPKTWGEMTDAEKFPFLLDWSENNAENVQQWNGSEWIKMRTGRFGSVIAYRIKPEPKLENLCEEVEIYGKSMMAVYEVENGDIVPDSIKIEEL